MPLRERVARHPATEPDRLVAARLPHRRSMATAVACGLLGFVLGAIFWHVVGFWDFVGHIMFKGTPAGLETTQAPAPIKFKDRIAGASALVVVTAPEACTTLQLDRATGITAAAGCAMQSLPLRSLRTARREDRWVTAAQRIQQSTARGWASVTVESGPQPLDQASAD